MVFSVGARLTHIQTSERGMWDHFKINANHGCQVFSFCITFVSICLFTFLFLFFCICVIKL